MAARNTRGANQWDPKDLQAVTRANAKAWPEWRWLLTGKRHNGPVESIPGFRESLDSLYNDQGYSQVDIGAFFGVSRERVRQWFGILGIETKRAQPRGSMLREWDASQDRFVCRPTSEMKSRIARRETAARRRRKWESLEPERQRHTDALRALAERLGRTPTLTELSEEIGEAWQLAAERCWGRRSTCTRSQAVGRLYASAGLFVRPVGGAGHVAVDE